MPGSMGFTGMKGERGFKGLLKLLYVKPCCTVEGHSCYLDAMAPL